MCCFSRPVREVSQTQIFARALADGRQHIAYAMRLDADEDLAMLLPLPVPAGCDEQAVSFIDLSSYPLFFRDLSYCFTSEEPLPAKRSPVLRAQALPVHDVGSFEASFVPHLKDMDRLDPRFRIEPRIWRHLPRYSDFGFAVFKLKATTKPSFFDRLVGRAHPPAARPIHPMAFTFPRRERGQLFFPTVHIHDGEVHASAEFDHVLYGQGQRTVGLDGWTRSDANLAQRILIEKTGGLIDASTPLFKKELKGKLPNDDVVVVI